MNTPELKTDN